MKHTTSACTRVRLSHVVKLCDVSMPQAESIGMIHSATRVECLVWSIHPLVCAYLIVNAGGNVLMMNNRDSASIDARTKLHRTHVRKSLVSGRSLASTHREYRFTQTDPEMLKLPHSDHKVSTLGYQVVRRNPETGCKEYAWFAFFGPNLPTSWQATPCPIPYGRKPQADAIVAQLGHTEIAQRVGKGRHSTVKRSFIRQADVWVELNR